jgi:hypothetical protein
LVFIHRSLSFGLSQAAPKWSSRGALRLSSHGGINDRLTVKRITIMTLNRRMWSRRKLTTFIAAGIAAIVLATGGYAIAGSARVVARTRRQ